MKKCITNLSMYTIWTCGVHVVEMAVVQSSHKPVVYDRFDIASQATCIFLPVEKEHLARHHRRLRVIVHGKTEATHHPNSTSKESALNTKAIPH